MGALQFVALASFPYATLIMVGITAASATWQVSSSGNRWVLLVVTVYGLACAAADGVFATKGSLGFYSNHASIIEFQPALLPHLIGGNWLILAILTAAVVFSKRLSPDAKWPLVGMGGSNLIFMLGDAVVPAKTILLSHHAAHFIHTSIAILFIFLLSATLVCAQCKSDQWKSRAGIAVACVIVAVNGILLSLGTYRGFFVYNQENVELAKDLAGPSRPNQNDLVIARSTNVDDPCGWIFLLTQNQVLYCTDAEVMLTPQQNIDIHRFRQAIYLYLTGRDSESLRRMLAEPNRLNLMYQLGYWAEAASLSPAEQADGVRAVEREVIPLLERVEHRDVAVSDFFHQFRRIIVVDNPKNPAFSQARLASFLKLEDERQDGLLQFRTYTSR